ncbi:hypothetical protein MLC59_15685 [Marinobacter bryozoorum]|uniref:hypothetical protein n=1 Tax=Marinobacter bryozoorum TaxID=256324 RepID=UPI002003FB09|nr:hypothetical protein [Marinobacter bryozoorum]MCK7545608.1 hypothetical protein [Marinobacter bryozoorum]
MNKSLSAAITTMLLITSSAWAASPESQAIRPTGDNMPDASPTEQADRAGYRNAEERRGGQRGDQMREERKEMRDEHRGEQNGYQRRHDDENRERRGNNAPE